MKQERKFKYWHIITAINKNYQEREKKGGLDLSVGMLVTHYPIHNGPVRFTNIKHPEFGDYWAYSILYVGKLPSNLEGDELWSAIKGMIGKCDDEPVPEED